MNPIFSGFVANRRYQLWILGAVALVALVAANAAWLFPTLDELETNAFILHRSIAFDIKNQLNGFLGRNEQALENAADILNQKTRLESETISRLMKENPPFESITLLDTQGKESLKNHRFLLVTAADLKDRSSENLFKEVRAGKLYRSPVLISDISEPIITVAVPLQPKSGHSAIIAEINLKFLLDVVRGVSIGEQGAAYVVDRDGYIIAHPNSSLVFGRSNVFDRKLVISALEGKEADTRNKDLIYLNEKKEKMLAVALPFDLTNWAVVVENPKSLAMVSSQRILSVAIISFGVEILLLILLIWNYFNLIKTAALFYGERNQRDAILSSLYDGVIEYDSESKIILMNPKAEELLGIKFEEVRGMKITPEIIKDKPKLRGLTEIMYPALATYASAVRVLAGSSAKVMEVHISQPELKLLITLTQVIDQATGEIRGFLKILHDISREQFLGKMKSEFVSIAAHQLRTPLSAIKWTFRLLLDGDAGLLTKEQQGFVDKGYEINERMIKLVNDLLNAARIEEGKFGYDFKETDLGKFFETLIGAYTTVAQEKNINLKFENIAKEFPPIYADPERLSLAVSNLLDNAIKYTLSGGNVIIKLEKREHFAFISISDTGVGIPESEQKRVFTKFFRASNVIKMETEGTGLGLFIVRNIIRRHGGEISFISKEHGGSIFAFTLPLKRELVPASENVSPREFLETI